MNSPSFARLVSVYLFGDLINRCISFLLIPLYTRTLSPAEYGTLSLAVSIQNILIVLFSLNLRAGFLRLYFQHNTNPAELRKFVGSIYCASAMVALILCAAFFAIAPWGLFGSGMVDQLPFFPFGIYVAITALLSALSIIPMSLLRVEQKAGLYITFSITQFLALASLNILFVVGLNRGAQGPFESGLIVYGLAAIAGFLLLSSRSTPSLDRTHIQSTILYSLPLLPHAIASWMSVYFDRLLLQQWVSLDDLGIYALACSLAMGIGYIMNAFQTALSPRFFQLMVAADGEGKNREEACRHGVRFLLLIAGLFALGSLFAEEVVRIIGSQRFFSALPLFRLIFAGYALQVIYYIFINHLFHAKKTGMVSVITFTSAGVSVLLNLVLIPRWGVTGAAGAVIVGTGLSALMSVLLGQRALYLPYSMAPFVGTLGIAVSVGALSPWLPPVWTVVGFGLKGVIMAGIGVTIWRLSESGAIPPIESRTLRRAQAG